MRNAVTFGVVLSLGAVLMAVSRPPSHVDISGHVYESDSFGGARAAVAGAVVSNDWDSTTATTNAQGEFRLRVRRVAEDELIKFTARAGHKAGWHRRVGSVKPQPVHIVLSDPIETSSRP